MGAIKGGITAVLVIAISSIFLIIMGLIYFMVTLWIVTKGADLLDLSLDGNYAVLSASLITMAVIIGSSLAKRE
ncbi:MAG: hypothetical protein KAX31_00100 [Thermoplasmata archaeon]|nr:hypothetical protein [Thermoplasmata archaeon]